MGIYYRFSPSKDYRVSIVEIPRCFFKYTNNNDTAAGVTSSIYAISGATQASPVVITTAAHGITTGVSVRARISDVLGMTELNDLDRNPYSAKAASSTTLELYDLDGNAIDGSAFTAYSSGGKFNIISHESGDDQGPFLYADGIYKLTLGTAVDFNNGDEIYFRAFKYSSYSDLGDAADF